MTVAVAIAYLRRCAEEIDRTDGGREDSAARALRRAANELEARERTRRSPPLTHWVARVRGGNPARQPHTVRAVALGHLSRVLDAAAAWRAEADEREARAANPEVVGLIGRLTEEAVVRTLRRCADDVEGS